ncbi:hypothetical protein [Candidatus Pelagibacter bacterium nBUS_25]|uniref:hypothetical protein n=1 Tax=Candidatus Pelagibacter bacterium nBUS_25 TaxID=3374187 RepID=UPI003EBDF722
MHKLTAFLFCFIFFINFANAKSNVCKKEKKYSQIWYYNNCDGKKLEIKKEEKKETTKKKSQKSKLYISTSKNELPEWANPTDKVLKYYANRYSKHSNTRKGFKFKVKADGDYKKFNSNLITDDFVTEQLSTTALLSFIMYANGEIIIDQKTETYSKYFNDKTKWQSMSMGKSIISYMIGHAICRGYISGINETMNWDIFDNTYYENAKLINVLNMASGNPLNHNKDYKRWVNNITIKSAMKRELKNTVAGKKVFNYSNMDTNVVASYLLYKMGHKDFRKLLNEIFNDKINVQHDVLLFKQEDASSKTESLTYSFYITRYDYLRIAVAILDDWNLNTCEGQYLKSLHENRIEKGKTNNRNTTDAFSHPKHYGGQFHMGISGKRDKPIFIMDGYGGQTITIDFENNKIITTHAIHRNYNWMELVHKKL